MKLIYYLINLPIN